MSWGPLNFCPSKCLVLMWCGNQLPFQWTFLANKRSNWRRKSEWVGKKNQHIKMPLCYLLPYDKDSVGGQIGNASETFPGHPQVVLCISSAQLLCSGYSKCCKASNINSYWWLIQCNCSAMSVGREGGLMGKGMAFRQEVHILFLPLATR